MEIKEKNQFLIKSLDKKSKKVNYIIFKYNLNSLNNQLKIIFSLIFSKIKYIINIIIKKFISFFILNHKTLY